MAEHATTPPPDFIDAAASLGVEFDPGDLERLAGFIARLYEANQRMNLTAVRDPHDAWRRHVLDSLTLLPWVAAATAAAEAEDRRPRLVDVGSGGGLPGLVLACIDPSLSVVLVEATGKKADFLQETAAGLGLSAVTVVNDRAERVGRDPAHREIYDLVTSRAVGPLPILAEYLVPLSRVDGTILAIKGARAEEELLEAKQALYLLHAECREVVPTETGRVVVLGKRRAVPRAYPREVGEPKRKPLA